MAISINSVKKVSSTRPPIISIYGMPGTGKTTFAIKHSKDGATREDVVLIRLDDGLGKMQANAFPQANSLIDFFDQLNSVLAEDHAYKWVCIDNLSVLEQRICEQVCADYKAKTLEDVLGGYGKGFVIVFEYFQKIWEMLDRIANKGIGVILIAHAEIEQLALPDMPAYDRYSLKASKRVAPFVFEKSDIVGRCFSPVFVTQATGEKKQGTVSGEYQIRFVDNASCHAKNRYELPEVMPLDWDLFYSALTTTTTTQKETN